MAGREYPVCGLLKNWLDEEDSDLSVSLHQSFSLFRELPPREWFSAIHEARYGNKNVNHAGVVAFSRFFAERFVQLEWTSANKKAGRGDAQEPEVLGNGRADIG